MKSIAWRRFAAILPTIILLALIGTGSVSGSGRLTGSQAVAAAQGNLPAEVVALRTASAADEAQVAPRVLSAAKAVTVTIDALANRHAISPYVYGFAYPNSAADITDSGATEVRWGGDATSTYNWQLETYNAAADYYFEDYAASGFNNGSDGSSTQFITDVKNAGAAPLMTMVMLPWVSQSPETSVTQGGTDNYHWSYSVASFGPQCSVDPYNTDAGDGLKTDCSTPVTTNAATTAYYPLLDDSSQTCPTGATCVYRNTWAEALATAFGSAPHFYDMDNEIEIWGSTHRDVHPQPSGYDELRDTYIAESRALKGWDPSAIRFGPITCCWWFYWNGANGNDKSAHAGIDFDPWWLNEVYWQDQIAGTRSLDVFDLHAYPDTPDTSSYTLAQKRALALKIFRDYWDPTFVSPSSSINQKWTTFLQPKKTIPFRIPRMRAIANMIYPGTPMSFTEWNAAIAGESDFSTALGDADAYGIFGRERMYLASRWTAPVNTNPNYQALKLYRNYDGQHHTFAATSVSDTNNASANLFSSYAAVDPTGKTMTVMVLNKAPGTTYNVQFTLNGFTPSQVTAYTLSKTKPTTIVVSTTQAWPSSMTFAPYSATLLVVTGSMAKLPEAEWDLNPDTTMVAAGGTVTLAPKIISGSGAVTLGTPTFDTGITLAVTQGTITSSQNGAITVTAGSKPGFYHYTAPSTDSAGVSQEQSGWILVGNPSATLTKQGDGQKGARGTNLNLSVTLNPGSSGGSATGADVFFTANAGTLSSRLVTTNSSGVAAVVLTLPASAGTVQVTAEGPYGLGHPVVTFTETSQ
ncbi:MAG: glycoside hydrolase family 44 protein [Terriglobales bacterium]